MTAAGLQGSDTLTAASQAFDSRNAGVRTLQVVAGSWTVADGNGGNNYAVSLGDAATGSITPKALTLSAPAAEYSFLSPVEKQSIHEILQATLPDLPAGWR